MKKGFSLIEALVTLALSSIVFLVVGSLLTTLVVTSSKSRRNEVFESVKNDVTVEISNAIRWASSVEILGSTLLLNAGEANEIEYKLLDGRVVKNGKAITSTGVIISSFNIEDNSSDPNLSGITVNMQLKDATSQILDETVSFSVSQRNLSSQTTYE